MSPRTVPPADEMLNPEEGREPPGPPPDEAGKRSNPGLAGAGESPAPPPGADRLKDEARDPNKTGARRG
ncbi:hypothetical protein CDO44_14170 [Pigmentiphaga sp. NML080357]|uniref:hypothetical protein n=1 Tax=Pigmentiphaga sp. NML080357 TaxID=2008675 RepID=UPI000B4071BA|nr:hypothetical protein [Pigmentiphaga sp. NML080357]OVZ58838.1 hypothetical protein CDO44_14170 [Pigmentiphaga sp. NML080357]